MRSELEILEKEDGSLTGEAMKEDVYRKACMRNGAVWLYDRILALSDDEGDGEIDLFG